MQQPTQSKTLESHISQPFNFIALFEIGAINVASPFAAAAQMRRPLIDSSGNSRAVPVLNLSMFVGKLSMDPSAIAAESKPGEPYNSVIIKPLGEEVAETMIIDILDKTFKGIAGLATLVQTVKTIREVGIAHGIYSSWILGQIVEKYRGKERLEKVIEFLKDMGQPAKLLWHGFIRNIVQAEGGVDVGRIILDDFDKTGPILTIYNANENVYAMRSDSTEPVILPPASIGYLPAENDPIDNSDLNQLEPKIYQKIEMYVLGIENPQMALNKTLENNFIALMNKLGYGGAYVPWKG